MIIQINPEKLVYERRIQALCRHPFYGHSNGCSNFNRKQGCPPQAPLVNEVLDLKKEVYLIFTEFNVGEFAERIRQAHPDWKSERRLYNPRYWQLKARKLQRVEEDKARKEKDIEFIARNPEANGVNVTRLMANYGFALKWAWPPRHITKNREYEKNTVYLVSLGGYLKK